MICTVELFKRLLENHEDLKNTEFYRHVKDFIEKQEAELLDILTKEKGLVTLNDDDSVKDVLIGVKEFLGK